MVSASACSAAAAFLLVVAVEGNAADKFLGFLESRASDLTTVAELLRQGAGVRVESCGGESDAMAVARAEFSRARLQVRAYGSLSRNVSGGTLQVKMYKGSAARGSSTADWLKREMEWHSVPHAYEEGLCRHFSESHSGRGCPLPAGSTELGFALDKLPPMVVVGAYKLKIRATDEAGEPVACVRAQVDVPRGKSGELFHRVEAPRTGHSGRTLSARGNCACEPSDPVCGVDGKTYAGACEAACAHVGVGYPGSCDGRVRPVERELTAGKRKILCLHGITMFAQEFESSEYYGMPGLIRQLSDYYEFVFAEGPYTVTWSGQTGPSWSPDPSDWSVSADPDAGNESLAVLDAIVQDQGPFYGILGFSQGASIAPYYMSQAPVGTFEVALLFCGFPLGLPGFEYFEAAIQERVPFVNVRVLVYLGMHDEVVEPASTLEQHSSHFENATLVISESGGHHIPYVYDEAFYTVTAFLEAPAEALA